MQLPLGTDPRTEILRRMQPALIARFGRIIRPSDKRRAPEWVLVHGVIGAQTKTAASNASTDGLLAEHGSWEAVAVVSVDELEARLQRQTFPSVAAQRLKDCLSAIMAERGSVDLRHLSKLDLAVAMEWLERLPGVARKNSAGVMNASAFDRKAMVIDGHHRRIMQRMGIVPAKADTAKTYDVLMPLVPEEWSAADLDEHHLLLKKLGQTHCRPRGPQCEGCPVRADCRTGTGASPAR
ncbi:endonuclease III domain-containing protein [Parerythrobacter jejuensis]|uniref:Endonuclease III n=1 Tax=Parerythrobacter jejuensis TaxID=795812 RepID=A0A845AXQ1_9SPHN|nr:endonuclease III [Parerythrobacter jejuensis]MXP31203.1 endonuclease III [Parerythrobacter jejuensis]MXP33963.1 endonuclease III [Parerythrobacter jejuensis]